MAEGNAAVSTRPCAAVVGAALAQALHCVGKIAQPRLRLRIPRPISGDAAHGRSAHIAGVRARWPYIIPIASHRKACSGTGLRLLSAMAAIRKLANPAAA